MKKTVLVVGPSIPMCLKGNQAVNVIHAPLITLTFLPVRASTLQQICAANGVIITSKHAASFLYKALKTEKITPPPLKFFCVGKESATMTRMKFPESEILTADVATQEGLVQQIIPHHPRVLFWPRSTHARRVLPQSLEKAGICLIEVPLYTPVPSSAPCSVQGVDIVFFTCPSSVDAFFSLMKPNEYSHLSLHAIGPVTQARLQKRLAHPENA
jgi:uroporphyrinogen-III synthase